jgi:CheY-like chemotaxis protein/anti-sigma regulatory factor (Ser/Thr protein kinase)
MSVSVSKTPENGKRSQKRILIVEDDGNEREGLRRFLQRSGFVVRAAADGYEALRLVGEERFDLMLADLGLPGMSGLELIAELPNDPRPRVVVVTGDDTTESLLRALREKACEYITKPFDPAKLLQVIRTTLDLPACADQIELLSADPHWVEMRFPCDQKVADHVQDLLKKLESDLPARVREPVEMAFHELVRNAIEWGGHLDPSSKVQVSFLRTDSLLLYRIADPGPGFDPAHLEHAAVGHSPEDLCAHTEVREAKGIRPGGFGILMAQSLVDELVYNEAHNEVLFMKYLHRPEAPPTGGQPAR